MGNKILISLFFIVGCFPFFAIKKLYLYMFGIPALKIVDWKEGYQVQYVSI